MTAASDPSRDQEQPAGRAVEREVAIAVPVEVVWKALTDAEELTRWFPLEARVTPGAGGKVWMSWRELYEAESRIEIWEPERRLRIVFPVHPPLRLATDFHLAGRGGITVLRVVTSGFGDGAEWDAMYGGVSSGWDFELRGMVHYLKRHRGSDRAVAWARSPHPGSRADTWSRLVGPGGWFAGSGLGQPVPGARYAVATAAGDELRGTVELWDPPRQMVLTVEGWNDALLRVEVEALAVPGTVTIWASTYGLAAARVEAIERRWRRALPLALSRLPTPGS